MEKGEIVENSEPRAWTLSNSIIAAMGAVILLLLTFGFYSITGQIRDGDLSIRAVLSEIKNQNQSTNAQLLELTKDVAVLKTNQSNRLERERIESETKARQRQ